MGSPVKQRDNREKIAICSFKNRICPRFDLTREILIFDGNNPQKEAIEKFYVSHVSPEKILNILVIREVKVVISGGMQERFQEMFRRSNINVIWGVLGEVRDVVEAYAKGVLYSGIGALSMAKGRR